MTMRFLSAAAPTWLLTVVAAIIAVYPPLSAWKVFAVISIGLLASWQTVATYFRERAGSVRKRALVLSAEILDFLDERKLERPPRPSPERWQADVQARLVHSDRTRAIYSKKFGSRVVAMRVELATHNLTDDTLESYYQHPVNPHVMEIVAQRIAALALRLPGKEVSA